MAPIIKRGEIWWVDFNSSQGGEVQKIRPSVIVSNDIANKVMNRIQVLPLTTQVENCYPCEAYIRVNGKMNKAMADQIATVSKKRLKKKLGRISANDVLEIERAIKVQLALQ